MNAPRHIPLVMLTAYDYISARVAVDAGVDLLLVGDSAANTVLGYTSTREVSLDEMLMLTRAVRRAVDRARVEGPTADVRIIGDLPFGTYESSDGLAVATAKRFRDAGADLVKLEGGGAMVDRVRAIVGHGIPVVGHVGLLPQGATHPDELRAQGRVAVDALQIVADGVALADAGIALLVAEAVPSPVARALQQRVACPVIGIGAGADVDGQVLVYPDLLGLTPGPLPRFVRRYTDLRTPWVDAVRAYAHDVRRRAFPAASEAYRMADEERAAFETALRATA